MNEPEVFYLILSCISIDDLNYKYNDRKDGPVFYGPPQPVIPSWPTRPSLTTRPRNVSWWGTMDGVVGFYDQVSAQLSGCPTVVNQGRRDLTKRSYTEEERDLCPRVGLFLRNAGFWVERKQVTAHSGVKASNLRNYNLLLV